MIAQHRGFTVTKLTGGLSATVRDAGGYVEVVLTAPIEGDTELSFDLDGWSGLVEELQQIAQLAAQVEQLNSPLWEDPA